MLVTVWLGIVLIGAVFGAEPRRCCFDQQFSVTLGAVGEVLTNDPDAAFFIDGDFQWGFDYYRDRQASLGTLRNQDGSVTRRYELKDYVTRRWYRQINNGTCTYSDIPSFDVMRPICIPDNATYSGHYVLGYGAHSLKVHAWSFTYPSSADKNSQLTLAVTEDHCVPVVETVIGSYLGTPIEESVFYIKYRPGIEDVNSLEIPTGCQEGTLPPIFSE